MVYRSATYDRDRQVACCDGIQESNVANLQLAVLANSVFAGMDKTEIVYIEGCTVTGIEIDGEGLWEIPASKQREILHQVIDKIDENIMHDVFKAIAENGEYKHLYDCDCCGDSVCEYRLEL